MQEADVGGLADFVALGDAADPVVSLGRSGLLVARAGVGVVAVFLGGIEPAAVVADAHCAVRETFLIHGVVSGARLKGDKTKLRRPKNSANEALLRLGINCRVVLSRSKIPEGLFETPLVRRPPAKQNKTLLWLSLFLPLSGHQTRRLQ